MKQYIVSPVCSAFVVPGLGQVLNHNLKKGGIILGIILILIVNATIQIALILKTIFKEMEPGLYPLEKYLERIMQEDLSFLFFLVVAFAVIWVYSVSDAFWVGLKIEKQAGGDSL
ncbi:MAG: hypothetical protein JRG79_02540 [Deltaproteobacteria bacterium]|nr:hypothetical protein [Deltaproteobacteria bacterium]MBW1941717.1 hypothetical protein [Deltaproteobacteria bacterium]MBW2205758.1 hypothetical protein [Deltaproteobacteria bacterium]